MPQESLVALQLCPLSPYLEAGLAERCTVVRWFELHADERARWLEEQAGTVRAVITGGHVGCPEALMAALPALGIVAINGVGHDKVDLALARTRGVRVTTTPDVLTDDVADLALGLVVALLRGIPAGDAHVRRGAWPVGDRPLARKVTGCRFGIVGLGQIGRAIATRVVVLGPVRYTGPQPKDVPYEYVADVVDLARESDVLILACAATPETRHLIDASVLEALGPGGYLVNVARGSVVDETALIEALDERRIAGAALDVFAEEPHVPDALRACERTVLTPHMASGTVQTRTAMADLVLANLDAFSAGAALPTAVA